MSGLGPPDLPELRLKRREERRILGGHLWLFSNEIDTAVTPLGDFEAGDVCRVTDARGRYIGCAYVNPHTLICARILSRRQGWCPDFGTISARLREALALRERLYPSPVYRWVFGESDAMPGLILDRYGDVVVGQIGTAGMERLRPVIEAATGEVLAGTALVWKNDSGVRELEDLERYVEVVRGPLPDHCVVEENGVRYPISVTAGQKTGWYLDQSANRTAFLRFVAGARVLDVFSYHGGWGLAAARAGARAVTCVDSSEAALTALAETAAANDLHVEAVRGEASAVLERLHADGKRFDAVVIDPPAFIKRRKDIGKGEAAYRRLNRLAMQVVDDGGILVSCSCSFHLSEQALLGAVQQAAARSGRFAQLLAARGQGPDHPVHPAMPETRYLKALYCRVTAA